MQALRSFFKRLFKWIWRKKWILLPILVVLIVGAVWAGKRYFSSSPDVSFVGDDYVVGSGDVIQSLNLGGTTKFANSQKLSFVGQGKVASVFVSVGDKVKKDQVLAILNPDEDNKNLEKLQRDLKNLKEDLAKKQKDYEGNRDLAIKKADLEYQKALQALAFLPQEQKIAAEKQEQAVKDKKEEYQKKLNKWFGTGVTSDVEEDKKAEERAREKKVLELIRALWSDAQSLDSLLDGYDKLLHITDKYEGEGNIYIGAKNLSNLTQARQQYREIKKNLEKLRGNYRTLEKKDPLSLTDEEILSAYDVYSIIANQLISWAKINAAVFRDSIPNQGEGTAFDIAQIDTWVKTYSDDLLSDYKWIDARSNAKESLSKLDDSVPEGTTKEEQIAAIKRDLDALLIKQQTDLLEQKKILVEAEQTVVDKKKELEDTKSGAKQKEEIDNLKDQIKDLEEQLQKDDRNKLIANFDGLITKVNMQVGDAISPSASADTMKYISVETPDLLELSLDVDQIDIIKIKIGMPVTVRVDALPGVEFEGHFSEIDTMPEGSIYKAKVVFSKNNEEEKVLGGMSANADIVLQKVENVVVVPNPALADNENGEKIVRLKKGEQWVDQVVEIGIANDANAQILSGLQIGDVIKGLYINEESLQNAGIGGEDEEMGGMGMMY